MRENTSSQVRPLPLHLLLVFSCIPSVTSLPCVSVQIAQLEEELESKSRAFSKLEERMRTQADYNEMKRELKYDTQTRFSHKVSLFSLMTSSFLSLASWSRWSSRRSLTSAVQVRPRLPVMTRAAEVARTSRWRRCCSRRTRRCKAKWRHCASPMLTSQVSPLLWRVYILAFQAYNIYKIYDCSVWASCKHEV